MSEFNKTIENCATDLEANGMTDETSAYRGMIYVAIAKLEELLSPEQLQFDLTRIRVYLDDLLGEDTDEPRH